MVLQSTRFTLVLQNMPMLRLMLLSPLLHLCHLVLLSLGLLNLGRPRAHQVWEAATTSALGHVMAR